MSIGDSFHCLSGSVSRGEEAAALLFAGDREPVFEEADARAHQHALDLRALAHEFEIFGGRAEAHHPLDAGAVVPGAVEEDDLARRRQVLDIALEIPLRAFALGRLFQRDDARAARVEVLHEALDRAALAGGVAALEQHDDLLAGLLDPVLRLQKLGLQRQHALEIGLLVDLGAVGIVAGLESAADRVGVAAGVGLGEARLFGLPRRDRRGDEGGVPFGAGLRTPRVSGRGPCGRPFRIEVFEFGGLDVLLGA